MNTFAATRHDAALIARDYRYLGWVAVIDAEGRWVRATWKGGEPNANEPIRYRDEE